MQPDGTSEQVAYGRAVVELGLMSESQLRAFGSACFRNGLDLRTELLRQNHLRPEDDERVFSRMGTVSKSAPSGVLPARLPRPGEIFAAT